MNPSDHAPESVPALVDRALDRLMNGLEVVLAIAFCGAVVVNFATVVARYVVNYAVNGADELQIQVLIGMAFLGAAIVQWRGQHLRMDVLVQFMPRWMQSALRGAEILLVLVLAGFVMVQSGRYTLQMYDLARTSDGLGIPVWISHGIVVLGFALLALATLWTAVHARRRRGAA